MKSSQYYLTTEVSHELSCSSATVRAMERSGKLKASRTPSGTRIFLADDVAKVKTERERQHKAMTKCLLLIFGLFIFLPAFAHAQIQLGRTWTCALVGIGATLTQCQPVPADAGERYVITDLVVQTSTGTAGTYAIRSGTGTNCGTNTAQVFPSSGSGSDRFTAPINSQPTAVIGLKTPLAVTADHAICLIGVAVQLINVQMVGFITR